MKYAHIALATLALSTTSVLAQDYQEEPAGCRLVYATIVDMMNGVKTCYVAEVKQSSEHDSPNHVRVRRPETPTPTPTSPEPPVDQDEQQSELVK